MNKALMYLSSMQWAKKNEFHRLKEHKNYMLFNQHRQQSKLQKSEQLIQKFVEKIWAEMLNAFVYDLIN